ncbi:SDR family NAD(P)-dependent oxidoreductase [Rhizorhabdus dicambivorans]|uniref:Short-chain dehydrogenase n=1 Tax=Rhizorhabdus dicambivorans TaxID=1850238 RepID=A0A2A4FUG9_9SPHN|nr:SDR family NAD(P)-dependent oxidoreductase [Rhizorhabdus dicambivorans]ATE64713.1 short-chain dehydrogenase [Rhizorhabdus dicambivorans]PCE41346.1 short-chain dehydrogenase [Rhizorhabdus dicambivorans]
MTDILADPFDLTGRIALVTGASSGLGARFARILARHGAKVVLAARRLDRLDAVRNDIERDGGQASCVVLDVADEHSLTAAFDAAEAVFGVVDTIIANAGVSISQRSIAMTTEQFDQQIAINLRGPFLTAREGARRLVQAGSREKRHGRILFITSILATAPEVGLAAYGASKAGVAQMSRVMALELVRQGINVNVIAPGYIETEMNRDWFLTESGAAQVAAFPRRRLMREADLDGALLYFASDLSRAVTGAMLTVDDGQSI